MNTFFIRPFNICQHDCYANVFLVSMSSSSTLGRLLLTASLNKLQNNEPSRFDRLLGLLNNIKSAEQNLELMTD